MDKKRLGIIVLAVLMLASVGTAAILAYFGHMTTTVDVKQSILLDGGDWTIPVTEELDAIACDPIVSEQHILKNQAIVEIPIEIETVTNPDPLTGVTTTYIGTAILTKKEVVFGTAPWDPIDGAGTKVTIEYSIIRDSFNATVIEGAIEGYELVYYKDESDRWNEPARVIKIADIEGSLPYATDRNLDEYDYCELDGYKTCHGAKIWYLPSNAINLDKSLDWSRANEFFYETELIQYNSDGFITLFPGEELDFSIVNKFDCALTPGIYTIVTNILPVIQ